MKICFLSVNTKYISSRDLKTKKFSLVLSTHENSNVFNSLDEIYLVFTSKKQISSIYLVSCRSVHDALIKSFKYRFPYSVLTLPFQIPAKPCQCPNIVVRCVCTHKFSFIIYKKRVREKTPPCIGPRKKRGTFIKKADRLLM